MMTSDSQSSLYFMKIFSVFSLFKVFKLLKPNFAQISTSLTLMFIVVETAGNCSSADRVQLQRIMTAALPHLQQQISRPKVAASRSRKQDLRLKHALIGLRNHPDINMTNTKADPGSCAVI